MPKPDGADDPIQIPGPENLEYPSPPSPPPPPPSPPPSPPPPSPPPSPPPPSPSPPPPSPSPPPPSPSPPPPSPSPPPPSPPPLTPGGALLTEVTLVMTVAGTVDAFNTANFIVHLAASIGVEPAAITLNVTGASVRVAATIRVVENAIDVVASVQRLSTDITALSLATGVTVESADPPNVNVEAVVAAAPTRATAPPAPRRAAHLGPPKGRRHDRAHRFVPEVLAALPPAATESDRDEDDHAEDCQHDHRHHLRIHRHGVACVRCVCPPAAAPSNAVPSAPSVPSKCFTHGGLFEEEAALGCER